MKSRCIDTGTAYTSSFLRSLPGQCYIFCVDAGVGVEGILRQCADVDDVDRRVKEYEQGTCDSESLKFLLAFPQ